MAEDKSKKDGRSFGEFMSDVKKNAQRESERRKERKALEEQERRRQEEAEQVIREIDQSQRRLEDSMTPAPAKEPDGADPREETQRFDTQSIERQLSDELGISMEEFRDLTDDPAAMTHIPARAAGLEKTAPLPDLASLGITQEDWAAADSLLGEENAAIAPAETPGAPEPSIEEQISRQVQEKVEAEEALAAAHRAEEERARRQEETAAKRPPLKRKKKKKGCLGSLLYFLFVIGTSLLLATVGWVCANEVLGLIKPDTTATIEIPENYTIAQVADILKENGIIEYPALFKLYAGFSHADEKIDPGSYEIRADLDYRAMVYAMRSSSKYRSIVRVTIPEGYTQAQIFQTLADNGVAKVEDLQEAAKTADFGYEWLEGAPETDTRLEGFLYPDTYDFYVNESPKSALNKMLYNFDSKMTAEWRERAEKQGYTIYEIVTVASLIEKESAGPDESPMIASVIYNRLNNWDNPLLNIDATIQYILPERKEHLTYEDLEIESPYNTYLHPGLPPGPIASPGYYSLKAALYPESSKYYYYALGDDGVHHFSKSAEEHEEFLNSLNG